MKKILLFLIVILSQFLLRTAAYSGRFSATEDGLLATALSALKQDPNYQSAANYSNIIRTRWCRFQGHTLFMSRIIMSQAESQQNSMIA